MISKPKIIFTIDAEVGDGASILNNAHESWFLGCFNGDEFGANFIGRLLSEYGIQANMFMSVLESYKYGEDKYDRSANVLKKLGHSVDLHTHPIYIDRNRKFMFMYSLEDQVEILKDGLSKIRKWIGGEVENMVHRAGSYSVNYKSYEAMKSVGITMDSSYYQSENCKVWSGYKSSEFLLNGVRTFPITSALFNIRKKGFLLPFKRMSKLDINQQSVKNIISAIETLHNESYIIIFLHSFSFMRFDDCYKITGVNKKLIEDFIFLLKFIKKNNFETCTLQDIE